MTNQKITNRDIIDVIKCCLLENENLRKDFQILIYSIKERDYTKIILALHLIYSDAKDVLSHCLEKEIPFKNKYQWNKCINWCLDKINQTKIEDDK